MPPASYPSTGPELRTGIGGVTECPWDPTFPVEGHIRLFLAWPLPHFWPRGGPAARPRGVDTHRAGGERCAGTTGLRASLQRDNHICFIGRTSPSDPAGSEEGRRDRQIHETHTGGTFPRGKPGISQVRRRLRAGPLPQTRGDAETLPRLRRLSLSAWDLRTTQSRQSAPAQPP